MKTLLFLLNKLYGFLLRLYPYSYRQEFAEEMLLDFSDMVTDASKKGKLSLMEFCLRELIDFPISLLRAHLKKASVNPDFHPGAARNILRIALAFGLATTLNISAGIISFIDGNPVAMIWQLASSTGWQGTYQDIQSLLLQFSNLVLGPVVAAITFLLIFPRLRPVKQYLPAIALVFCLPSILGNLRLAILDHLNSTPNITVSVVASLITAGLGFGIVAAMISQECRKIPWLLVTGCLGYFLITWASNLLLVTWSLHDDRSISFWSSVLSLAMRNILMGMAVGLLLGVVLEFKRRDNSPSHFLVG